MKKKWMAAFLSVVLAVGLSVPAFAEGFEDSGESGDPADITQLVFSASSYKIARDDSLDLKNELTAYCGSKKICQYPDYEFSTDDSNLVFDVTSDGIVSVWEDSGSATVTVKELNSGKKATCRVVATKSTASTGFKLEPSPYVLYTEADGTQQEKLRVIPTGTTFNSMQRQNLIDAVKDVFSSELAIDMEVVTSEASDGAIEFRPAATVDTKENVTLRIAAQMKDNSTAETSRSLRVTIKSGNMAQRIGSKGSIKLEVGKTADLYDYISYNSSATYAKECDFYLDYYNEKAESADYAVLGEDGHTIKGVAVGKLYAVATLKNNPNSTAKILVNVVPKGSSSTSDETTGDMSITPTSGSVRVGGTMLLTTKNVPADSTVDWIIEDEDIISVTYKDGKATVKGLKVGATVVTAEVDGEQIGKAKITVTSAAAESSNTSSETSSGGSGVLPTPPVVINPPTGDSWFANLF